VIDVPDIGAWLRDILPTDPAWLFVIALVLVVVFLTSRGGAGRLVALGGAMFVGALAMAGTVA